jgi:sulfur-oxidizing protein SoxY
VPVAIRVAETLAPETRGLYLIIDNNPSPLAAHLVLGPIADARAISTRVRIDDYTYLHAVVETADGRLYAAARFIKAAGGCSAPAGKDQALALERLGKMKLSLADRSRPDEPVRAKLLISHPNSSGLQMDQVTRNYIPADFMQTLDVTYNGEQVFRLESDIAISEDPSFNFRLPLFQPGNSGSDQGGNPRQQPAALQSKLARSGGSADVSAPAFAFTGTGDWPPPGPGAALR